MRRLQSAALTVALFAALVLPGCIPRPVSQVGLRGTWTGTAAQYDSGTVAGTPDSEWTVVVVIDRSPRVSYPSLGCSGRLDYRAMDGTSYVYTETITEGQDRCAPTGTVTLTPDGRGLTYEASHESQPSVSVARLTRQ